MKTIKNLLLVLFAMFVFGCGQDTSKVEIDTEMVADTGELFEAFIKKFNADQVFQRSRIVFPFKVVQTEQAADGRDTTILVEQKDWQHVNFLFPGDARNIVDQSKEASGKVTIRLMVEDTGSYLEHFFEKENGQWWLVYVKDGSN